MGTVCIDLVTGILPYGAILLTNQIKLYYNTLIHLEFIVLLGQLVAFTGIYADSDIGGNCT